MRIGFDARFLTHPQPGGFKTYSTNLVASLAQIDPENEYVLYLDRTPDGHGPWDGRSNFQVRIVPGHAPLVGMPWREQVGLARAVAQDKLDVFHAPCLTAPLRLRCPLVVTIHDMIWQTPSQTAPTRPADMKRTFMTWYYRAVPELAARRAAAVITVSQAAKQSIAARLGLPPTRITVTHEAANPIFRRITDPAKLAEVQRRFNLNAGFVLAIGSADPRKNVATVIEAYSRLPVALQTRHPLAVVWTHSLLSEQMAQMVHHLGLAERVRFVQEVSDEELACLYNMAAIFVFPSRYEGFGLPLLEAMACGAPVVAANNSSIPEVAGDAAVLIDAEDSAGMADAIASALTHAPRRRELIERGLARAQSFSWERCAQETIDVYQRVGRVNHQPIADYALPARIARWTRFGRIATQ